LAARRLVHQHTVLVAKKPLPGRIRRRRQPMLIQKQKPCRRMAGRNQQTIKRRRGGVVLGQSFGTVTSKSAWSAADIADRLQASRQRLAGVQIETGSWHKCFASYNRPHSFFYLDPPYWQTAGYGGSFEWAQYEKLAETMADAQGKAMLSINDHPDIRALFKDFSTTHLELAYSINHDKTQKTSGELVICNW